MIVFKEMSETEIQADILRTLRKLHVGFFWRNNNVGVYDVAKKCYRKQSKEFTMLGISDILGCYRRKFVAIEVKTPAAYRAAIRVYKKARDMGDMRLFNPTESEEHVHNQILFIEEVIRNGGIGFFTYGTDHTLKKLQGMNIHEV